MFIITRIFSCVNKWVLIIIETSRIIFFVSTNASTTDNANVKVINCNNAQTVSANDKTKLSENGFTKCAEPFGILIAGSKKIKDKSVLAMAKVVAELLDQNKDGKILR